MTQPSDAAPNVPERLLGPKRDEPSRRTLPVKRQLSLADEVLLSEAFQIDAEVEAVAQARQQLQLGERGSDHLIGAHPVVPHPQLAYRVGAERRDGIAPEGKAARGGAVIHGDGRRESDYVDERKAVQALPPRARERHILPERQAAALQLGVDAKVVAVEPGLDDGAVLLEVAARDQVTGVGGGARHGQAVVLDSAGREYRVLPVGADRRRIRGARDHRLTRVLVRLARYRG